MKTCPYCSHQNPDIAGFCSRCGKPLAAPASTPSPTAKDKRGFGKWIAIGAGVVIVIVAVALFQRINGLISNAVIEVIPAGADAYVEIDLLEISEENMQDLVDAYSDPLGDIREVDIDIEVVDDIFTAFDDLLDDEFRMTVEDDVVPWIGRHVAVAGWAGDPDPSNYEFLSDVAEDWVNPWGRDDAEYVVAIQVREAELADDFLEDVVQELEDYDSYGYRPFEIDRISVDGTEFYEVSYTHEWDDIGGDVLIGRSGDVIIAASSKSLLRDALDAQSGSSDSLADDASFAAAMAEHPAEAFVRGYLSADFVATVGNALERDYYDLERLRLDIGDVGGAMTAALWFTESGLQGEIAAVLNPDEVPDSTLAWLEGLVGSDVMSSAPGGERWAYAAVPGVDLLTETFCDELIADRNVCDDWEELGPIETLGMTGLVEEDEFGQSLVRIVFRDPNDARRYVDREVRDWEDCDRCVENGGPADELDENLWVLGDRRAMAITGRSLWGPWNLWRYDNPIPDVRDEFDSLKDPPTLVVADDATLPGVTTVAFVDGKRLAEVLDASRHQDQWAPAFDPIHWFVAGLDWDGNRLRASAAIEWEQSDG